MSIPLFFLFFFFHAENEKTSTLNLNFSFVFDNSLLKLNSQAYIDANGDSVYIDVLKFYISDIQLMKGKKISFSEKDSYHLVDAGKSETNYLSVKNIPPGDYDAISFHIGVDSATNCSGAMGGDLDPVNGMYWEWNSGYINAKLEGHSSSCKTLHHAFEYHIGGYHYPHYTIRKIVLPLKNLRIPDGETTSLNIKTNVAEWFKNPVLIDLSKTNSIVTPGKDAAMMADNYFDMFSVEGP